MRYAIPAGTRVGELSRAQEDALFARATVGQADVRGVVAQIIEDVRTRGDAALLEQALRFDGVADLCIEVPRAACQAALEAIPADVRDGLEQAAANIAAFHRAQLPELLEVEVQPGIVLGRRADPLERIGVYAPGGRAAYPSSVLMGVVPARVAGVAEVIVCSPPGQNGVPPIEVLAACAIAKADRVFALGGAGAIAALALGTDTVPRVNKVVGPGNAYVTEAKIQLNGAIGTDCPAGPSEVLVLADDSADPEQIAWEIFAQAEHDPAASCVLVTRAPAMVDAVVDVVERALPGLERKSVIESSLRSNGALLVAADDDELLAFTARYAPEHLILYVENADTLLARVRNAGTVLIGSAASVVFGDYLTGANHVLPTAGHARTYSGLSVLDYVRWTTYQKIDAGAAARMSDATAALASAEGLPQHARAARMRSRVPV
jgi:histidinol dehydrogenase